MIAQKCKCPPKDEGISKAWYRHTIGYLDFKRSEILIHVTTWMKLENIMLLSEISQDTKEQISYDSTYIAILG